MELNFQKNDNQLTVVINGSVDTVTAPQLEVELKSHWEGITELIFDFANVDYVSSAGLRVMMIANSQMEDEDGEMKLLNVNEDVMEVFEMTGFDEILTFE